MTNKINLIAYDFDGVMTDNSVYLDQNGIEMVRVNRGDGLAVSEINKMKIEQIIISTEKNPVVQKRAKKINISCYQCVSNKLDFLKNYCEKNELSLNNTLFIGNDINDKEVMEAVRFGCSPADAHQDIINISDHVFSAKGGQGVIRELLDYLILNNY